MASHAVKTPYLALFWTLSSKLWPSEPKQSLGIISAFLAPQDESIDDNIITLFPDLRKVGPGPFLHIKNAKFELFARLRISHSLNRIMTSSSQRRIHRHLRRRAADCVWVNVEQEMRSCTGNDERLYQERRTHEIRHDTECTTWLHWAAVVTVTGEI